MKQAVFHPKALATIREFPEAVRRELGKAIFDLQKGERLGMPLSRPMQQVSSGVEELRIKDRSGIFRVFYYSKLFDRIAIFHAFVKKTQTTPKHEIDLGLKRLKEMTHEKI